MRRIIRLETVSSTQDEAFRLAAQGAEDGTLVVAAEQTAGRGRRQRRWESPKGAGAYFSVICRAKDPSGLTALPFAAGIAAARAIGRLTPFAPRLKWPNDILIDRKKVAGVLVESRTLGDESIAAVGVGINLRAESNPFIQENPDLATALDRHCESVPGADALAEAFVDEFDELRRQNMDRILEEWRGLDDTIGSEVEVLAGDRTISGMAKGLDENGALLVEAADGRVEALLAGDVSVIEWRSNR